MSESSGSSSRPRRSTANYTISSKIVSANKDNSKFNPIQKKVKFLRTNTQQKQHNIETNLNTQQTTSEKELPELTILLKDNNNKQDNMNIEETLTENNSTTSFYEDNSTTDGNTQEWTTVNRNKGKNKETVNNSINLEEREFEKDENDSVISYNTETDYQTKWRDTWEARKYKIWTLAERVKGKTMAEKLGNVRKTLGNATKVIMVKIETYNSNRMIAAYYDNKEEMEKGNKIHVGVDANQPAYMHRAEIFKRNPDKEIMQGVKLWDVPMEFKQKELKEELETKFGEISRLTLRINSMWQSAHIIFKNKENAQKLLDHWSILIGEDSVRVTPINVSFEDLKTRGKYAARVRDLPYGITARELWPHVEKIGAKTCYIPRTRSYRRKREAIISFEKEETFKQALNITWKVDEFEISLIDAELKTCHRCNSTEHLAAKCPRKEIDKKFNIKNQEKIDKFGAIYKKHKPRYYNMMKKQTNNLSYADVLKNTNTNINQINNNEDRLERIERMLVSLSERLDNLEQHVWETTEAYVEEIVDNDETMSIEEADTTEESNNINIEGNIDSALNQIVQSIQHMTQRINIMESKSRQNTVNTDDINNQEDNLGFDNTQ